MKSCNMSPLVVRTDRKYNFVRRHTYARYLGDRNALFHALGEYLRYCSCIMQLGSCPCEPRSALSIWPRGHHDTEKAGHMRNVALIVLATKENFDERGYLAANPDVAEAVRAGQQAKFSIGVGSGPRIGIQKGTPSFYVSSD
jgi:hypothetical protein